ncbi:bifunctional DNA primase/polymerase [Streptomyces sp. NPDC059080]|uniref:bifunctional DNA primase/polymerase n=1 Tax=Streptomyces sp. NPDC059080 TaxID=3346718 RepID=UPI0036B9CA1B
MTAFLGAALVAAARGWAVFPLRPGTKRPALHGETRCPRTGPCAAQHLKWEQRATTDPRRIEAAWSAGPFNIGLATGPSKLLVVDLDVPKGKKDAHGATTFQALCERAGQPVPTTYTVRTPTGGHHLYFTAPTGTQLNNTAGALGPLIDTRAAGGYVVASGSATPAGAYTVADDRPAVLLPDWLRDTLTPPRRPAPELVPIAVRSSRYAAAALRAEVSNVVAADGTRNATLLRAARALGRLVASGDLRREEVEEALSGAAMAAGRESQRYYDDVINRALNWSIAHNPRGRTT